MGDGEYAIECLQYFINGGFQVLRRYRPVGDSVYAEGKTGKRNGIFEPPAVRYRNGAFTGRYHDACAFCYTEMSGILE